MNLNTHHNIEQLLIIGLSKVIYTHRPYQRQYVATALHVIEFVQSCSQASEYTLRLYVASECMQTVVGLQEQKDATCNMFVRSQSCDMPEDNYSLHNINLSFLMTEYEEHIIVLCYCIQLRHQMGRCTIQQDIGMSLYMSDWALILKSESTQTYLLWVFHNPKGYKRHC